MKQNFNFDKIARKNEVPLLTLRIPTLRKEYPFRPKGD